MTESRTREYKRLGDYIRPIDKRNRDLKINLSQGICNAKFFQTPKQIAENPETHKIVRTGQFAYNRATTRNGDKLSIALRQGPDCTVSAAYQVFEVSRPDLLLPEYLMMWFKRPEFDRLALFYSHGSAHEFFEWESMCDVQLPVPSIERQREIVSEYETLTRRIRLNEQMIEKLEATAQALYRHTFIDNIDKQNLPQGTLGDLVTPQKGRNIVREECIERNVPVIAGGKTPSCFHNRSNTGAPVVTISASGANAGYVGLHFNKVRAADCSYIDVDIFPYIYYIYELLSMSQERLYSMQEGTGQPHIYPRHIMSLSITLPSNDAIRMFHEKVTPFFRKINLKQQENIKLTELQSLLLAKMGQ